MKLNTYLSLAAVVCLFLFLVPSAFARHPLRPWLDDLAVAGSPCANGQCPFAVVAKPGPAVQPLAVGAPAPVTTPVVSRPVAQPGAQPGTQPTQPAAVPRPVPSTALASVVPAAAQPAAKPGVPAVAPGATRPMLEAGGAPVVACQTRLEVRWARRAHAVRFPRLRPFRRAW